MAETFVYDDENGAEEDGGGGDDGDDGDEDDGIEPKGRSRPLFRQQRFVRDYLQERSPYRGLLLYHSLGVGKTCAAIAAAEALRPTRDGRIFVMVTKMLRGNFAGEVPTCTSPDLLRDQSWARVPIHDPRAQRIVRKVPAAMVRRHDGVWLPADGSTAARPYDDLDAASQAQIDAQIEALISASFRFIHYNGITQSSLKALLTTSSDRNGTGNPFDDAVVIIDEVHNFVSRVVNRRLLYPVYDKLLDAQNCKIILLSGTPIVNHVSELAFLVNLVQGRSVVHEFRLRQDASQDAVEEALKTLKRQIRHLHYDPSERSVRLTFMPSGFVAADTDVPGMVTRRPSSTVTGGDSGAVTRLLRDAGLHVAAHERLAALPLPDDEEEFDALFVDERNASLMNPGLLQRRILGAVSTYRQRSPQLFARVRPMEIVLADMSSLQFTRYAQVRHEERRREQNISRLQMRANGAAGGKGRRRQGVTEAIGQVYRSFSLALCTFVFPDEIPRPFKYEMRRQRLVSKDDAGGAGHEGDLDQEYLRELHLAVQRLQAEMPQCLDARKDLREHSPKFHRLLQRLAEAPSHLSLVYTRLRQAEGVELLTAVLNTNGWREVRLVRDAVQRDAWVLAPDSAGAGRRYIVLRTEGDPECNRLLLHMFNGEFNQLPTVTRDSLLPLAALETDPTDPTDPSTPLTNLHGEIAQVFIITASGAEGISLKNVRQVHLLESFWNHNRIDQVVGRAVRANSHSGLPPQERQVSVYLYLSNMSDAQRQIRDILNHDKGLTSDQYVHSVAMKKKMLNDQALALVRAASVDCRLYPADREGVDKKETCFELPRNLSPDEVYRTLAFGDDLTDSQYGKRVSRLVPVEIDGKRYYLDQASGNLYDYERLRANNELVQVKLPSSGN